MHTQGCTTTPGRNGRRSLTVGNRRPACFPEHACPSVFLHACFFALCFLAVVGSGIAADSGIDRYMEMHEKIKLGPKMQMEAASFFGGAGYEEFVGVTALPEGRVLAVGNSWGPPFVTNPAPAVLGADRLWDIPLYPAAYRSGVAASVPSLDHPNRTGFLAVFSPRLDKVERIVRFGWGSASIAKVLVMRDGAMVFAGRAWRPLLDFPCPSSGFHAFSATNQPPWDKARNDSYIAKLAPDGKGFEWVWTLIGQDEPPRGLYEGANKEIIVQQRFKLLRISGDGATVGDFFGTDLGKIGPWYIRAANDKDGTFLAGGGWMTSTGREPWRQPWLNVYDPNGKLLTGLYPWMGHLVGHDDYRLVSDSSVDIVTILPTGRIAIAGKSDGGNTVFARHPVDLDVEAHGGLPFSLWGAGVGTFFAIAAFDPSKPEDVARTVWCSYRSGSPSNTRITSLGSMQDGCVVVTGIANDWLIQTTQQHFRDSRHYLKGNLPTPDDWPVWLGLGGAGDYVAVLTPNLDSLIWASVMPCCEHTGTVAVPGGLVAVARCNGTDAHDGRSPALFCFNSVQMNDIRNWPGMIRKLVDSASGAPTPVQRIWTRLSAATRQQAQQWIKGAVKGEAIPAGLRTRLIEDLDELIFDARSLYDPAVWLDPGFDSGELATVAKLKTAADSVTREELGFVNRRLLEKALPDHVFVAPRSNKLLAMKGAQMDYGGGPGDGFIYFLRSASWQSARPSPKAAPTAVARAGAGAVSSADGTPVPVPIEPPKRIASANIDARDVEDQLTPAFTSGGSAKVPGYTTYAVCRSPERRRPLFQHGRANGGDFKLHFSRDVLESSLFKVKTTGGFVLEFTPDVVLAADVDDFAAADWLRHPSQPHLRIAVLGMKKWTERGEDSRVLFDPGRGGCSRSEEPLSASFTALADLEVAAGGKTVRLKDVPVEAKIRDRVNCWSIRFDTRVELPPDSVDEKATLPVKMKISHETFCPLPAGQKAPAMTDPP